MKTVFLHISADPLRKLYNILSLYDSLRMIAHQSYDAFAKLRKHVEKLNGHEDSNLATLCCNLDKNYPPGKFDEWGMLWRSDEWYKGMAAICILRKRHGLDYVLNLAGLRRPKTIREHLRYYITGKLLKL